VQEGDEGSSGGIPTEETTPAGAEGPADTPSPDSSQEKFPASTPTPSVPTTLPPEKVKAEDVIAKALTELSQGQVYHNVPEEMKVGVSETIEAGIAPEVTEKIKKELQGKGAIHTQSGVAYDPSGVEMKLVVNKDEFDLLEVRGGKQFVTAKTPGKWIWQVTPKKSGDNLIIVKAVVELNVPELKVTRPVEVEVFSATRRVDVNLGYSVSQFVSTNWKEVLGLVIGSGSLASLVTWWIGRKEKETKESSKG
jgi:hypothetical protein